MGKGKYDYDIYMVCPVRKATSEEKAFLKKYRRDLELMGLKVCYSLESANREDEGGYNICHDHCFEIHGSKEIRVYWKNSSTGCYIDLGSAMLEHFMNRKSIKLINRKDVEKIVAEHEVRGRTKSYEHVLLKLDDLANGRI